MPRSRARASWRPSGPYEPRISSAAFARSWFSSVATSLLTAAEMPGRRPWIASVSWRKASSFIVSTRIASAASRWRTTGSALAGFPFRFCVRERRTSDWSIYCVRVVAPSIFRS